MIIQGVTITEENKVSSCFDPDEVEEFCRSVCRVALSVKGEHL